MESVTHVAYSDESNHNDGRYRGLAVISLPAEHQDMVNGDLKTILEESSVSEFKWTKLNGRRYRACAEKLLCYTVSQAVRNVLRVDVLTWDIEDSRNKVEGRDDIENLKRMYYHLFKNTLSRRWPEGSNWALYPDRQSALDWDAVGRFLIAGSVKVEVRRDLFTFGRPRWEKMAAYRINGIRPIGESPPPAAQLADLFAGMGVYSRSRFDKYQAWVNQQQTQQMLFPVDDHRMALSASDRERCPLMHYFIGLCQKHKLGVSLNTCRGLKTFDPSNPINFWMYEPQSPYDKAPVRG